MLFACILTNILAIALPSLRISPLLLIRIATIALLYAAALSFNVVYIQSIGSGIGIFSGLFHVTLISQSIETFFENLGALILMPWSLSNAPQIKEYPLIILFTLLGGSLLLSSALAEIINPFYSLPFPLLFSVLPIKPVEIKPSKRLTNSEKKAFTVTRPLTDIIIGLCLGDLYLQRQKSVVNTCLHFKQGICHNPVPS